jgi:hypothetical protein
VRSYRPGPTVVALALFVIVGDLILVALLPGPVPASPQDEMWMVYYAVLRCGEPPAQLDDPALRSLLVALDPAAEEVAERVRVRGWEAREGGFTLEAEHTGDGRLYRITPDGVY